jgi:hypothetical protein
MTKIKTYLKPIAFVVSLLIQSLIMYYFYSVNERQYVYWTVITILGVLNLSLLMFMIFGYKLDHQRKRTTLILLIGLLVTTFAYSYFEFNYVVIPADYFKSEVFYYQYKYGDLKDDVRIEYYARNFQGQAEIYRESYNKDEIKAFLNFFRNVELEPERAYENLNHPNVFLDWNEDIHVMIRNMEDDDNGYYVFHVDIVDTSDYVKSFSDGTTVYIYKLPAGLREFAVSHLTK